MATTFKKTKHGFSYCGNLDECIEVARRKIGRLQTETVYITRRYVEEKRRYEAHFKAIEEANDFIEIATEQIETEKKNKEAKND